MWYHCLQTSSEKDTEQQQGQEQTQLKGKVKQLQDELEVTDQQITALNPLLHLDTLRQRCEECSLTTSTIICLRFRYVCWQLTQTIGLLFKTFVDTSIEKNFLGATEYAANTSFLKFEAELHIKPGSQYDARASIASRASGWRWNRLDFYSSIASRALASVQPIRLSKILMSGMQFDWWKKEFFSWRSQRQHYAVNQALSSNLELLTFGDNSIPPMHKNTENLWPKMWVIKVLRTRLQMLQQLL